VRRDVDDDAGAVPVAAVGGVQLACMPPVASRACPPATTRVGGRASPTRAHLPFHSMMNPMKNHPN